MIWMGPTGSVIKGHVLDNSRVPLERKMREYDPQLYVRWNPKKLKGYGCWEVRRRPEFKRAKEVVYHKGNTLVVLDYIENGFENHLLDVAYLNYNIITELKRIDTWQESYKAKDFGHTLEYKEAKRQEELEAKAEAEKDYALKQNKTKVRDLMAFVNEGGNPARIADYWDKA